MFRVRHSPPLSPWNLLPVSFPSVINNTITHTGVIVLPMHHPSNKHEESSDSGSLNEKKATPQSTWTEKKCLDVERASSSADTVTDLRKAQFAIQGMTCSACPGAIRAAVEDLDGVVSLDVHLISNQAIVVYQYSTIDKTRIGEAIEDSGYGAILCEDINMNAEASLEADIRTIEIEIHNYMMLSLFTYF